MSDFDFFKRYSNDNKSLTPFTEYWPWVFFDENGGIKRTKYYINGKEKNI